MTQVNKIEFFKNLIIEQLTQMKNIMGEDEYNRNVEMVNSTDDINSLIEMADLKLQIDMSKYVESHIVKPLEDIGLTVEQALESEEAYINNLGNDEDEEDESAEVSGADAMMLIRSAMRKQKLEELALEEMSEDEESDEETENSEEAVSEEEAESLVDDDDEESAESESSDETSDEDISELIDTEEDVVARELGELEDVEHEYTPTNEEQRYLDELERAYGYNNGSIEDALAAFEDNEAEGLVDEDESDSEEELDKEEEELEAMSGDDEEEDSELSEDSDEDMEDLVDSDEADESNENSEESDESSDDSLSDLLDNDEDSEEKAAYDEEKELEELISGGWNKGPSKEEDDVDDCLDLSFGDNDENYEEFRSAKEKPHESRMFDDGTDNGAKAQEMAEMLLKMANSALENIPTPKIVKEEPKEVTDDTEFDI